MRPEPLPSGPPPSDGPARRPTGPGPDPEPLQGTPRVFAVLGGVASGKSTVSKLLAGEQGEVLSADGYAHEVLALPETRAWVAQAFGPQALTEQGTVDRGFLAGIVFQDPEKLSALESWIHPRVRARMRADLEDARARSIPRIVLDIPLLMESDGLADLREQVDHLVFVEVSLEERERRAGAQRGWAPGEVARREAAQMPLIEKRNAAHFVLNGNGTLADLERDVRQLLQQLGV